MLFAAVSLFAVLLLLVAVQAPLAAGLVRSLARASRDAPPGEYVPKVAVLLSLRGADPFLESCIAALAEQDYPNYEVRIVVDHPEDPALAVARSVVDRLGARHVRIEPRREALETCTLKISSLLQALGELDASHEVVAFLDADTVAHRTWLRELVAPLADERVGASTGNRWFMPDVPSWGAVVRYLWNSASVVQMFYYGFAWGGSLAVRRRVLTESDVLVRWRRAYGDDTLLGVATREMGLRLAFPPRLMIINRETCSLRGFVAYSRRQLLSVRLHHPSFPLVVLHGALTAAVQAAALGLFAWSAAVGAWRAAAVTAGGLLVYLAGMVALLAALEWGVRRVARARGERVDWIRPATAAKIVLGIPLTQAVYTVTLIQALLARGFWWRGIYYAIEPGPVLRMTGYRPYLPPAEASHSPGSIT